jgi:peroxiredoxin
MKHNLKSIIAFAAVPVVALLMMTSAKVSPSEGYKVGDNARDFNLKNIDGSMVSLAKYNAATKGAIVIFTCNHCPVAQAYQDRIIALNNKYQLLGYPVVAINSNDFNAVTDDSYENMQKRAKEKGFTFPYLLDPTQEIAKTYGAMKTPHVYVLQKEGNVFKVKYIGAIDDNKDDAAAVKHKYVETAVNELLSGKEVSQNYTKAIGCGIKWKPAN